MSDRDCNRCLYATRDGGCASWDCNFISIAEAERALVRTEMFLPEPKCADGCIYGWGSDECEKCRFKCEQKRGRWLVFGHYECCSECGEPTDEYHNYCPNCGAKMIED